MQVHRQEGAELAQHPDQQQEGEQNEHIQKVVLERNHGRLKAAWRLSVIWRRYAENDNTTTMGKKERIFNWIVTIAVALYQAVQYIIQNIPAQ